MIKNTVNDNEITKMIFSCQSCYKYSMMMMLKMICGRPNEFHCCSVRRVYCSSISTQLGKDSWKNMSWLTLQVQAVIARWIYGLLWTCEDRQLISGFWI